MRKTTKNGMKIGLKSSIMNIQAFVLLFYTVLCGSHEAAYAVMTAPAVFFCQNSICRIVHKTVYAVF